MNPHESRVFVIASLGLAAVLIGLILWVSESDADTLNNGSQEGCWAVTRALGAKPVRVPCEVEISTVPTVAPEEEAPVVVPPDEASHGWEFTDPPRPRRRRYGSRRAGFWSAVPVAHSAG